MNPSSHASVISSKPDGKNSTYHLVVWLRSVPPDPVVEFKYQASNANETSIGTATRVGTSDTFEAEWNVASVPDGPYVLKALLYSGNTEVARDEQEVTVNQSDEPFDPQADTVELLVPSNTGPLGFYSPASGAGAIGLIDVTTSESSDPTLPGGTNYVRATYTISFPGEEPVWKVCGTEPRAEFTNGVRCTLASGDRIEQVTAVAAVANSGPASAPYSAVLNGAGDAHRMVPYVQRSSTVSLTTPEDATVGTCTGAMTATVLDQSGRRIAGANLDIHAKGPTDDLFFDDTDEQSPGHQPPDRGHTGNELARNCEGSGTGGNQGQHEVPPPDTDVKHIETLSEGTSDTGQFSFALYSAGLGEANVVAFGDDDDDDLWCSREPSGTARPDWIRPRATASPTGSATASGSPSPSPSPSDSATSTPTPTGSGSTGSPSASPSRAGDIRPETTSCLRPGPDPTGAGDRTVSLEISDPRVRAGKRVTFSGRIEANDPTCEANEAVHIRRRVHGRSQFADFHSTTTEADGTYTAVLKIDRSADFLALAPAAEECDEASSPSLAALARAALSLRVGDPTPRQGANVRFRGKVSPSHRGTSVVLQRRKGTRWLRVATDRLDKRSRYLIRIEADWGRRTRIFRVLWPKQDQDHRAGPSKKVRITPR